MDIEIITIGDELLLGFTVDTNAAHLARELSSLGIQVRRRASVGDDATEIADAVKAALARTGAVITTGGLGPTSDDLTKPSIAALFGREMVLDEDTLERIRKIFRARGYPGPFPEANRAQAMIPVGARILTNRHGSAPGIWLEDDAGRWVAMLPGVPREMKGMLADTLGPILAERAGATERVVRSRTLRTTGIAESALADSIGDLVRTMTSLSVAYLPGADGVDVRLTARALEPGAADELLGREGDRLRERIGGAVYGEGTTNLASVVIDLCRARDLRIAVAESCTGGLLGARITAVPGSSAVFIGGVIAYADRVKRDMLGVDATDLELHGAVSERVVWRMAAGARERFAADIGVAISGVAGPGGGSSEKPVGTVWVALNVRERATVMVRRYPGDRDEIRERAVQAALDMMRHALLGAGRVHGV
jgi:nicotinamide-nucleotide amidase